MCLDFVLRILETGTNVFVAFETFANILQQYPGRLDGDEETTIYLCLCRRKESKICFVN